MDRLGKYVSLSLAVLLVAASVTLFIAKTTFAETNSPHATPESQTFFYNLPNGYTVIYEITSYSENYLIGLLVMDNPPIEINFNEIFPNGTEIEVTKYIAYGMTISSTSYPTNITFTKISDEPTPIPSSSFSIPTITPSPSVPEFPITATLIAVLVAVTLLLIIGKRKLTIINH
jgi:hypothetical protein